MKYKTKGGAIGMEWTDRSTAESGLWENGQNMDLEFRMTVPKNGNGLLSTVRSYPL